MAEFVSSIGNLDKAVVGSYGTGRVQRDFTNHPVGSFQYTKRFSGSTHPRNEWRDEIERQTKEKCRLTDIWYHYNVILLNQQQTPWCWGTAPTGVAMLQWARKGNGKISLSNSSVCGPICNFGRMRGGYGGEALKHIAEVGITEASIFPVNTNNRNYWTDEARENAKLHRFTDWTETDVGAFDQLVELVLYRHEPCFIGVPSQAHEVEVTEILALPNGQFGAAGPNTWGMYNADGFWRWSERTLRNFDCFSAPSMTN